VLLDGESRPDIREEGAQAPQLPHTSAGIASHDIELDRVQQALIDGLRPWGTGAAMPNFLGSGETLPYQVTVAYRDADYEGLTPIKATYDPHNLFRVNHNIPPAS
jgi:hypothetical protein